MWFVGYMLDNFSSYMIYLSRKIFAAMRQLTSNENIDMWNLNQTVRIIWPTGRPSRPSRTKVKSDQTILAQTDICSDYCELRHIFCALVVLLKPPIIRPAQIKSVSDQTCSGPLSKQSWDQDLNHVEIVVQITGQILWVK